MSLIALGIVLALAGCGDDDSSSDSSGSTSSQSAVEAAKRDKPKITVPQGAPPKRLVSEDLIEGTGPTAKSGDEVTVHYVGVGYDSHEQFDTSWARREPFTFELDGGEVIPGWDQGLLGMKVGGRRELILPPDLAYGSAGAPPVIGPNETLIFVVDLLAIK